MIFKTLIFSKNRACQLELLLRSLNIPTSVLYTYDSKFKKGYEKVIKMYPRIKFIHQTNFQKNLISFIKNCDYVLFLTDDDVMIAPLNLNSAKLKGFIKDKQVASLSLGLSAKIAGKKWRWREYKDSYRLRMWGYPMSVDSCIFRKEDIFSTIQVNEMENANYLESALNLNIPNRPLMMCFEKPLIINNSVNQVQSDFPAHTSGPSPQELEKRFLMGERLSLEDIKRKAKSAKYYRMKEEYIFEVN